MANSYLAQQRAPMFAELAQKPWLTNWLASIGESENSGKPLGILESLFNRSAQSGKSIEQLVKSGFYGPRTVQRLQSDTSGAGTLSPKAVANAKAALDQIKAGSNVTQGATDQGQVNEIKSPFKINVDGEYYGDMDNGAFRAKQQAAAAKAGDSGTAPTATTTPPASTAAAAPPGPSTPSPSSTTAPATGAPGLYARGGTLPGDLPGRSLTGVSPVLREMLGGAKAEFEKANPGYTIVATSGARPGGPSSSQHAGGNAIDMQIVGPNGQAVANTGNDPSGLYHQYARYVYAEQQANHPELNGKLAWGGAFGTELGGGGPPDLMHFDLGGERGHWTMNRPSQLGALPLQLAGATNVANGTQGPAYGPPVPAGNIVQGGRMYAPAGQGQAQPMGGKGHGIYIPILSELFGSLSGGRMGQKGGYMQPTVPTSSIPGAVTAQQNEAAGISKIPIGPALQVGPTAGKGPFQPQPTTAPTTAAPRPGPGPLAQPSVFNPPFMPPKQPSIYQPGPAPTTQPQLPASLQPGPQPPPGPVSPLRIQPGGGPQQPPGYGGPSRGVTGADSSIASTLAGITAPAQQPGAPLPGYGGPSRGITGGQPPSAQPGATVAGINLSTSPAAAPPNPAARPSPYAPGGPYANPYNPGGVATPAQLAARGTPSPASLLGITPANAAEGPSAAAAVANTQTQQGPTPAATIASRFPATAMPQFTGAVPIPRPNPIAGTQTGLTIPPRGPWPPRPMANVPIPRPAPGQPIAGPVPLPPPAPGQPGPAPMQAPPLVQNLGGTQMPPGARPGVRMLDAIPPDYVPPGAAQGQAGSFAERFGGAPGQSGPGQYQNPALAAALARYQGGGYPQSTAQGGPVPVGPGASQPPTPEQVRLDQLHRSPVSGPVPTSSGDTGAPALQGPGAWDREAPWAWAGQSFADRVAAQGLGLHPGAGGTTMPSGAVQRPAPQYGPTPPVQLPNAWPLRGGTVPPVFPQSSQNQPQSQDAINAAIQEFLRQQQQNGQYSDNSDASYAGAY